MLSQLAVVDQTARLGADVSIAPFTVVHANVAIGDGTQIGSHCVVGHPGPDPGAPPLTIGAGSTIRSHSVLYEGSTFGVGLETGHGVTLREGLTVGENLRVGTQTDLQGDTTIGDYVRIHSSVFVGKYTAIGDYVWIFPQAMLANDPHPPSNVQEGSTIDDYAAISAQAVVLSGVHVGRGSVVSAGSVVTRDVAPGDLVVGVPARRVGAASEVSLRDHPGTPAYPWTAHFRRGYPAEVTSRWDSSAASD
jgi:acetyltransferase-like isoleucine patch superfamily enzyme